MAALRQACTENPKHIKKIISFLDPILGSDAADEIRDFDADDQLRVCLEHVGIGLSVGDISEDDVWKLVQK